jgi:kynureninase
MNKGVSELVDNWEDWSEILTTSNNTSQDWTETTSECTKAVAELVGASKDLELPDEFFKAPENLELLKEAA